MDTWKENVEFYIQLKVLCIPRLFIEQIKYRQQLAWFKFALAHKIQVSFFSCN